MKEIIIKKIDERKNYFVAYFKHEFLKSTFFISFTNSIIGAVALNDFFQMLKKQIRQRKFQLCD